MRTTLKELAASGDLASRGASALIKAGYADSTPLKELTPAVSHARGQACCPRATCCPGEEARSSSYSEAKRGAIFAQSYRRLAV